MDEAAKSLAPQMRELVDHTRRCAREVREQTEHARELVREAQQLLATAKRCDPLRD